MFYYLILLILKLACGWVGIQVGIRGYHDVLEWNNLRSQQTMIVHYTVVDGTSSSPPEVVVELPTSWRPGQSQSIRYEVISLGSPSEEITFTLHSDPVFKDFGTPITFSPQGARVITQEVTLPLDAIQNPNNIYRFQAVGEVRLSQEVGLAEPAYVTVVSSNVLWRTAIQTFGTVLIYLVIIIAAILFIIYVW